jgi:hypothetical protein
VKIVKDENLPGALERADGRQPSDLAGGVDADGGPGPLDLNDIRVEAGEDPAVTVRSTIGRRVGRVDVRSRVGSLGRLGRLSGLGGLGGLGRRGRVGGLARLGGVGGKGVLAHLRVPGRL